MPNNENTDDTQSDKTLKERFERLPKVVQDAINSAEVQGHLRTLANTHKLHLDQWQVLENDVMLTLLGFQRPEDLGRELRKDLDVDDATAEALASDISRVVFDPIRKELERELDHPAAEAKVVSGVESAGAQEIAAAQTDASSAAAIESPAVAETATPISETAAPVVPAPIAEPPSPPETKVVRAPVSEDYKAGEASTERKDIHNDPYRESPA